MNKIIKCLIFCFLALSGLASADSGTVIGNGGDPIFQFLNATRRAMIETIQTVAVDRAELGKFCSDDSLEPSKQQFCRQFFSSIAAQIVSLNRGVDRTKFVLREEPLLVEGPDGQPMSVAARTQLGPDGVIEFHRGSVKTLMPAQVLFLVAHEFQHKAEFEGQYVTDNDPIGPFADGRELLDMVADHLSKVARKKGLIGTQFGIQDIFDCSVLVGDSRFGARISSARRFSDESLMTYETTIGKYPTDGTVFLPESSTSDLFLRVKISEPNNCGDPHPSRNNTTQIMRRTLGVDGDNIETLLAEQIYIENPMCPDAESTFVVSHQGLSIQCEYFGSTGTTSSQFSLLDLMD